MNIPPDMSGPLPGRNFSGFSLIELLAVMGIVAMLAVASTPAIRSLGGAGTVNKAVADSSRVLELARVYAMANNTYVRVALARIDPQGGRVNPATVVISMCAANGKLGSDGEMADPAKWPLINKPLILDNFVVDDELNASLPDTSADVTPAGKNRSGEAIAAASRRVPGLSAEVTFSSFIQISPSGESRVAKDEPARNIKVAIDQSAGATKNPFILRLSGANGTVSILRKDDGI